MPYCCETICKVAINQMLLACSRYVSPFQNWSTGLVISVMEGGYNKVRNACIVSGLSVGVGLPREGRTNSNPEKRARALPRPLP